MRVPSLKLQAGRRADGVSWVPSGSMGLEDRSRDNLEASTFIYIFKFFFYILARQNFCVDVRSLLKYMPQKCILVFLVAVTTYNDKITKSARLGRY